MRNTVDVLNGRAQILKEPLYQLRQMKVLYFGHIYKLTLSYRMKLLAISAK